MSYRFVAKARFAMSGADPKSLDVDDPDLGHALFRCDVAVVMCSFVVPDVRARIKTCRHRGSRDRCCTREVQHHTLAMEQGSEASR